MHGVTFLLYSFRCVLCCCQLSCAFVLTCVLAVGVTQVTTAAQEAGAALSAVAEVPGATQGAGAASFPQENSGEDTQMLTAPSATEVLVAAGASSTVNPVDAEGRILLQGLTQDGMVHLKPVSVLAHSSLNTTSLFK